METAYGYARRLAESLASKHWPENVGWEPLPDLIGVLSQIDNMTTLMDDQKRELEAWRAHETALFFDQDTGLLMERPNLNRN